MKRIKLYVFSIICFMIFSTNVMAAGIIKANSTSITKGSTVTVTATISSGAPLVSIEGSLSCSGAGVNGGADLKFDDSSNSIRSKSFTYSAKATTTGTITCSLNGARYTDMSSDGWQSVGASTITIKVSEPVKVPPKQLSADNNLKSLSVDGQEISPAFNKDVLEYKLTVDEVVEKLNIKSDVNDSKASVSGVGEVNLANGENTFEIKVTAENGNEKVYKLIVTVEDQHPISTKLGKNNLTVVKKNNDLIEKLDGYEEQVIKIDNQDVVSYYNKKTKVTLVLLKDSDNKIGYYVYDEKKNTYTEYKYIKVGDITLQLIDGGYKLDNFKKYSLKLQDQKIDFYKIKKSHKVGLIYGTNIKTGNTGYYVYDQNEETLSKYFDEEIELYKEDAQKFKNYLMIFMGVVAFVVIVVIIVSISKSKVKKRRSKIKKI